MKTFWRLVIFCTAAGVLITVIWRLLSRRYQLPCPPWLGWMLTLSDRFIDKKDVLERADIDEGMNVLDAGCGYGRLTLPIALTVGPQGQVVALDIQPRMLEMLQRRMEARNIRNIYPISGGLGEGLLPGSAFDRALLVTVLGEIPNRSAAFDEIFSALRPGGILSVTEIFPDPHYQAPSTVRRLAEQAGFRVKGVFGNALKYTLNLEKPAV